MRQSGPGFIAGPIITMIIIIVKIIIMITDMMKIIFCWPFVLLEVFWCLLFSLNYIGGVCCVFQDGDENDDDAGDFCLHRRSFSFAPIHRDTGVNEPAEYCHYIECQ